MKCLFLSDAHYPTGRKVADFLLGVYSHYNKIYILGDLFEFYYGYKNFVYPHHLKLINVLRFISNRTELILFEGNHEYKLERIKDICRVRIVELDTIEKIENFKVYMAHGDTIDKLDIAYRLFRASLKNPFTLSLINTIPPDKLLDLSRIASGISKYNLKSKKSRRTDFALEQFAKNKLKEGVDVVLLGHTHTPVFKKFTDGLYINTGEFYDRLSYAVYENGEFDLRFYGGGK